jgi:corrinoid protein of di/trimethylamine methyltransferase
LSTAEYIVKEEIVDQAYFDKLAQTVVDGEAEECVQLIEDGLEKGVDPVDAIEKGLGKGIMQVGDDFGAGVVFLPELIMAADVMKKGTEILDVKIRTEGTKRQTLGKLVIGTVKGDIHDIGKSVVAAVLQANGFDVADIGIDVAVEDFIKATTENDAEVLGMSTLLTLPLQVMGEVIQRMDQEGLHKKVKVMVGGCPVTQEFADEIGADAVGFDAADAVKKARTLLGHD